MAGQILVLGTRNGKKRRELEELLDLSGLELRTLSGYPNAPEVEETGATFLENAALKATTLARSIGQWVLGEDSGLCVDALDGEPGVYSARFAGEPPDDERNNDKLLELLEQVPDDQRTCHYVCTAVLADPSGEVRCQVAGECHGYVSRHRRGTGGFGYDPLFLIASEGRTFGELPSAFKQRISHRALAMRQLRPRLVELMTSGDWPKPVTSG